MNGAEATLVGNLTRDWELKFLDSGRSLASSGVAVNRRYNVGGEWKEEVSFFNLTAWGDTAGHLAESTHKGDRVILTGRFQQRSFEDTDGNKRSTVDFVVDEAGVSLRFATAEVHRTTKARGPVEQAFPGAVEEPF